MDRGPSLFFCIRPSPNQLIEGKGQLAAEEADFESSRRKRLAPVKTSRQTFETLFPRLPTFSGLARKGYLQEHFLRA
jgi:hypothetical protein